MHVGEGEGAISVEVGVALMIIELCGRMYETSTKVMITA